VHRGTPGCRGVGNQVISVHFGADPESVEKLRRFLHEKQCRIGQLHGNPDGEVFRHACATDLGVPLLLADSGIDPEAPELGEGVWVVGSNSEHRFPPQLPLQTRLQPVLGAGEGFGGRATQPGP
jgi:hypothetical protein